MNTPPSFSGQVQPATLISNVAITPVEVPAAADADGDTITYTVTGLPTGLTFTPSTRRITGTPTALSTSTLLVSASDGRCAAQYSVVWNVVALTKPAVQTFMASPARINPGSTVTLTAAVDGSPATLTLAPTATQTGNGTWTAAPADTTTFTLTATNEAGTDQKTLTIEVNHAPAFHASATLSLSVGRYVSMPLAASDGDAWESGPATQVQGLPPGLAFNAASGLVYGTPTVPGSYQVTASATDGMGLGAAYTGVWTVAAASSGGGSGGTSTPCLPPDDQVFTKRRFSETLGYSGSETGMITAVEVLRDLHESVASIASNGVNGKDKAPRSVYQYGYDPMGQLVRAHGDYTDMAGQSVQWTDHTEYSYDLHGNRTTHTPSGKGAWIYQYQANTNRLLTAGPRTLTHDRNGAITGIIRASEGAGDPGESQDLIYGDARFTRLPTRMARHTQDGRLVETGLTYDMSGTRILKRDYVRQTADHGDADPAKLVSDRETLYLANGTETLLEVERRPTAAPEAGLPKAIAAPRTFIAYIFGAGSRLARLSWDEDGNVAGGATPPVPVSNPDFETGAAEGWNAEFYLRTGTPAPGTLSVVTDATKGKVLKITRVDMVDNAIWATQRVGRFKAGQTLELTSSYRTETPNTSTAPSAVSAWLRVNGVERYVGAQTSYGPAWNAYTLRYLMPEDGDVDVVLLLVQGYAGYFDDVKIRVLPPATLASGKTNYWPDPGFESLLMKAGPTNSGIGASGVLCSGTALPQITGTEGSSREGKHVLSLPPGAVYQRTTTLDPAKTYLFSIWKNTNGTWIRETRAGLRPAAPYNVVQITLDEAGLYDQAELIEDPGAVPESWIPENRLGRVDWFITDHLGSTKLLLSQDGSHRFTGDDDPYGLNLRSFGDKDTHRFTGQILDEAQGLYYYGARYYLPDIGRFLSGDPAHQFHNPYVYVGNNPIMATDPTGRTGEWFALNMAAGRAFASNPESARAGLMGGMDLGNCLSLPLTIYGAATTGGAWWPGIGLLLDNQMASCQRVLGDPEAEAVAQGALRDVFTAGGGSKQAADITYGIGMLGVGATTFIPEPPATLTLLYAKPPLGKPPLLLRPTVEEVAEILEMNGFTFKNGRFFAPESYTVHCGPDGPDFFEPMPDAAFFGHNGGVVKGGVNAGREQRFIHLWAEATGGQVYLDSWGLGQGVLKMIQGADCVIFHQPINGFKLPNVFGNSPTCTATEMYYTLQSGKVPICYTGLSCHPN